MHYMDGCSLIPINYDQHRCYGWKNPEGFGFALRFALCSLAKEEISRAAQSLPVALRQREGRWEAVAVMGPVHSVNVMVDRLGRWRAGYVPAVLRVYPFALGEGNQLCLWPDYRVQSLADSTVKPFFDGEEWPQELKALQAFLVARQRGVVAVHTVVESLAAHSLLRPWPIPGLEKPDPARAIDGLFSVDSQKLLMVEGPLLKTLFKKGDLRWIYAHIDSLYHAERFKLLGQRFVEQELLDADVAKNRRVTDVLQSLIEDQGDAAL
ncbi:MAG: SapC family protein [Desulfuromonadales bacterium]|nr:SapC family protein [Desulfuromonadales bacterium]